MATCTLIKIALEHNVSSGEDEAARTGVQIYCFARGTRTQHFITLLMLPGVLSRLVLEGRDIGVRVARYYSTIAFIGEWQSALPGFG